MALFDITETPSEFASPQGIKAGSSFNLAGNKATSFDPLLKEAPAFGGLDTSGGLGSETGGTADTRGGLTNTGASTIGAGIQAGAQLAQGVAQGVQTARLQDSANLQGISDLDTFEREQSKNQKLDLEAQDTADANQRFTNMTKNVAFRQQMFQRDLQDKLDNFNSAKEAIAGINSVANRSEGFRDTLLNLSRR
jgi:hypothetical protein